MTTSKPRILYVEDDTDLSFVVLDNLKLKGYDMELCADGLRALDKFREGGLDLCILDVMLPVMDGFALAREIRKLDQDIPILFLSAKSLKEDRIEGLTLGGDDYITKPFSIEELVLKIEIFLKRGKKKSQVHPMVTEVGSYSFNAMNLELKHPNETIRLTSREADLLNCLVSKTNQVIRKEEILNEVWRNDSYFNSRSLDVFISKLRKYLRHDPNLRINNIHGIGFILVVDEK